MQMQNMSMEDFRITQKNGIFGAFGAVVFISCIYLLTKWFKPSEAVIGAVIIYTLYIVGCKYFFA
jgi:hypothetical protein